MEDFIAEVAKKGGMIPERFGCCHGAEQATGAVPPWARERIGRLALRESAMAIEVNQSAGVVPGMAAETAPGVWDVWGGSGNRPTIPPPLWR